MAKKAPGKAHREGISLIDLLDELFPTDEAAQAWLEEQRWGGEPWCPHCGSFNVRRNNHKSMPWRCAERECRKRFSVRSGTPLQGSPLGYRIWVIAIYLLTTSLKGQSSMKLHRDLKVTQKTAWFLAHRIRKTFDNSDGGESGHFTGPVEVDETYMGGKRKNMSNAKRKQLADEGAGRRAVGKTAIVGAKDRATKQVRAQVVESTDKPTLQGFVVENTAPDATVYTDEASAYEGLPRPHEAVKHSVSEYVRGQVHTNGMESFWSMMKRGYIGIYHKMSPKHLDRYVDEFAGRHNLRESDTLTQMGAVVRGFEGKRLTYGELIAPNGLDSGARGT